MIAGFVFSIVGIASILFAARWGRLSDKIGFQRSLLIGLLAGGIGSLAQILFSNIWAFSAIRFCLRRLLLCRIPGTQRPC